MRTSRSIAEAFCANQISTCLRTAREPVEADDARIAVHDLEVERGAIRESDHVGLGERLTRNQFAVDHQIDRCRVRRDATVFEPREHRLQLDRRGVGDELQPTTRRHRRHEPDRRVDQLRPRPCGQTFGERTALQRRQIVDPGESNGRIVRARGRWASCVGASRGPAPPYGRGCRALRGGWPRR